ncbi:MAG: hypothetical protein V1911_01290 [Candidatus Micrarchaeota archaeon]
MDGKIIIILLLCIIGAMYAKMTWLVFALAFVLLVYAVASRGGKSAARAGGSPSHSGGGGSDIMGGYKPSSPAGWERSLSSFGSMAGGFYKWITTEPPKEEKKDEKK